MAGAGSRIGRTTSTLLTCAVLTACQGAPSAEPPADDRAERQRWRWRPAAPHFAGRLTLALQPALVSVGETACTPARNRVCSSDGTQGWAPITDPGRATLVEAVTHLADEHTSWTTVLRFDPASRPALARGRGGRRRRREAWYSSSATGERVAAVAPPSCDGSRATFTGLDQAGRPGTWSPRSSARDSGRRERPV